jgi:GntR family transcriptional regulator of vanillate catabolism
MESQLDTITQQLRELILSGEYEPGRKLGEVFVAQALNVSRTPARLAMAALETEGLLVREPNRGFRVRAFTIEEAADAVEVRGELEAMAARLAAERGLEPAEIINIERCLGEAEALLERGLERLEDRMAWIDSNAAFHAALMQASRNEALVSTITFLSRVPLAGARGIVFDRTNNASNVRQVRASNQDHQRIYDAIRRRQGERAAALVREHAFQSAQNKRNNFASMKANGLWAASAGLTLIN